jgi:hypothetical protein
MHNSQQGYQREKTLGVCVWLETHPKKISDNTMALFSARPFRIALLKCSHRYCLSGQHVHLFAKAKFHKEAFFGEVALHEEQQPLAIKVKKGLQSLIFLNVNKVYPPCTSFSYFMLYLPASSP